MKKKETDMCQFKILDCTLRDGGYYTNWDFPSNVFRISKQPKITRNIQA